MQRLSKLCLAITSLCLTTHATASDFSLPFVNASSLGVAYADWATATNDASTSYTNAAAMVYLPGHQVSLTAMGITGSARFTGTATTPSFPFPAPTIQSGVAKTDINAFFPSMYYAGHLSDRFSIGAHLTTPFGLGTDYGSTMSMVRYAATRSQVVGIDAGASLAYKVSERFSIGGGLDALHLAVTLNNLYGPPLSMPLDSVLQNHFNDWGFGWHAGALLKVTSRTRLGFSYNSLVALDTRGHSTIYQPNGVSFRTNKQEANISLPARAQLSLQQDFTDRWTGMATAFYTNWRTFKEVIMKNTETPGGYPIAVTLPFNYSNCFDYSVGATYKATEKWLLRGGVEFMGTPSNNHDRGIADPIGSATIVTVGAHFNATEQLGVDLGVGHSFFKQMPINYRNALTALKGHTNAQTTVIGGQVNWKIA